MRVLLLGANGYMGPHLVKVLEKSYQLRITDIMPIESEHDTMAIDVTNLGQVMEATKVRMLSSTVQYYDMIEN